MSVRDNYLSIMEGIESARARAGRAGPVKLIAVTKYVDTGRIAEGVAAGIRHVGENRAQELRDKLPFFRQNGLDAHLIGQLQTNKVKYVIGNVSLIQSVDRPELAREISRLGAARGVAQDVLIQVNIGGEPQKGGVAAEELPGFIEVVSAMPNILVKGLMCIPPDVGEAEARKYFARMRRLFEDTSKSAPANVEMRELSMGMSGDYIAAILEGATMVRVGTALFGARE